MQKSLRLGISGSSFAYVMPEQLRLAMVDGAQSGIIPRLDERGNELMVDFMRDMMCAVNASAIGSMECYHSLVWDKEPVLEVMLDDPEIEFWSVHAPYGRPSDPSSPIAGVRDDARCACCDAIDVADRIGARVVVVHPGSNVEHDGVSKDFRLGLSAEVIGQIADYAADRGISIAVEPLPYDEPGNSLESVLMLLDAIDRPNAGVNFDVNHLFPPESIPGLIRKAGDRILSMHISDQDGRERHWLPMRGNLDWAEILRALIDIGYSGPLIYETHIQNVATCAEVVRAVEENYRELIALAPVGERNESR